MSDRTKPSRPYQPPRLVDVGTADERAYGATVACTGGHSAAGGRCQQGATAAPGQCLNGNNAGTGTCTNGNRNTGRVCSNGAGNPASCTGGAGAPRRRR